MGDSKPTASQVARAAEIFEDIERLLGRFGGVGLGISVLGVGGMAGVAELRADLESTVDLFRSHVDQAEMMQKMRERGDG